MCASRCIYEISDSKTFDPHAVVTGHGFRLFTVLLIKMAWTASTEWERWDPEQYITCPYDASHRIAAARFQRHLVKCRKVRAYI